MFYIIFVFAVYAAASLHYRLVHSPCKGNRFRLLILKATARQTLDWEVCDDAKLIRGNEVDFSDIVFFPFNQTPSVIQKEHLKLLGMTLLLRVDPQLEYLIVSNRDVIYCQPSVRDEIFKAGLVSCVKKNLAASNFVNSSKPGRLGCYFQEEACSGCGTVVAYKRVDDSHPPPLISKDGKLHEIFVETGDLSRTMWEEMLLTGALFASLGAAVAYVAITFVYTRYKLLLTRKLDMALRPKFYETAKEKKKSHPPAQRKRSSANSVLTNSDMTTKVK